MVRKYKMSFETDRYFSSGNFIAIRAVWTLCSYSFSLVCTQEVRREFFVLQDDQPGLSIVHFAFQNKGVSDCMKDKECKFVTRYSTHGKNVLTNWHKVAIIRTIGGFDCLNLRLEGRNESRVYPIIINGKEEQISCDMTTDGGGWTIFQRRVNGSVNFYRNWNDYKIGFGDRKNDFWLGLDLIHSMISQGESELRVDVTDYEGRRRYAKYARFYVGDESEGYTLTVSRYSGTTGDVMRVHNAMKFSTFDRDNDRSSHSCARAFKGGFWYFRCVGLNANGLYSKQAQRSPIYICWFTSRSEYSVIKFIEMKFRRKLSVD